MNQRRRNVSRAIAALLLFSITQIGLATSATAIPQQFIARLTTRNNQPITVNGLGATTGASILTGATIETGADQSATVNLGPLGSLDIAPNTKLVLTYDEHGNVKALIIYGCAILRRRRRRQVKSLPSRVRLERLIRLRAVCWMFVSRKARRRRQ